MSNTSKGKGEKGSKFWIQILVNTGDGKVLSNEIKKLDSSIEDISWISPLEKDEYEEYKLNSSKIIDKLGINKKDMDFWPQNQPQWDAIGIVENCDKENNTIILVEAKAHVQEMNSACTAKDEKSIEIIEKAVRETWENLSAGNNFDREVWMEKYYQLGNRLAFLYKLKEKGYNVKLVLLNVVNDPTYKKNTEDEWMQHYKEVFGKMLGNTNTPEDVIIINVEVNS